MSTYVSLLRGINVSGKNLIKMEVLREIYSNLGFQKVKTYLQSGNVIFSCEKEEIEDLPELISKSIEAETEISIKVFVFAKDEWLNIAKENPFSDIEDSFLYVTFLNKSIDESFEEKFNSKTTRGEKYIFAGNRIYLYYPEGYGLSKLDNNSIETITRSVATTRNRKTVNALKDLLQP
jgi:uncharacterized protein (DUF1697 family)